METIAIYWEKQVKVYGIMRTGNLRLLQLKLAPRENLPYHSILTMLEREPVQFELLTATPQDSGGSHFSAVIRDDQYETFAEILKEREDKKQTVTLVSVQRVEIIYLHGPHFQERFGILARATEPLCKAGIVTLATGCAGNSMYLVLPDGHGVEAIKILQDTFQTP